MALSRAFLAADTEGISKVYLRYILGIYIVNLNCDNVYRLQLKAQYDLGICSGPLDYLSIDLQIVVWMQPRVGQVSYVAVWLACYGVAVDRVS